MEKFVNFVKEMRAKCDEYLEQAAVESAKNQLGELRPGEKFCVDGTVFVVLQQCPEENQTKVIQWDLYAQNTKMDDDSCDYIHSDLKKKYDTEITPAYEKLFGAENIVQHKVDLTSVDMQKYGTFTCKTRPITFDEAREFNELIVNEGLPDCYWTCTSWSSEARGWKYAVAVVAPSGDFDWNYCFNVNGVRPVCILKSNIFVSEDE